jgi:serine/threonine protein kinase
MSETLSEDDRTVVTARADQFRRALVAGGVTDWDPFLAGLDGAPRLSLLVALIVLDLGYRWGKGERPAVEDYVRRFPDLGPANTFLSAVVIEEFRCRRRAGEAADTNWYRERFPALFPALQADLDVLGASWTISDASVRRWEPVAEGVVAVSQQYELVRELGRGMFGEVWLARKKPSGIEKAIKILLQAADRESAQRELKSLELIKNLRHPYLLATEDFWIANNRLHVVMELADGTLRARLKHYQSQGLPGVPLDELFRYIAEAAEGLDFLHEQKITHRDVKPDNILILHGHAKLADFGLARAQAQLIETMSFAGTPAYMAPEVWGGEGGPASDQYSLAYAYTELRQGRPPLKSRPFTELQKAHQAGDFEFTDTVTERERSVLRRAMASQSHHRYPTCTAFVADLAAAVDIPFAGGSIRNNTPRVNPSLSAIFGSGTAVSETGDHGGTDTIAPTGTVVIEEQKPKRAPRWRLVLMLAICCIPPVTVLGVCVWLGSMFGWGKIPPAEWPVEGPPRAPNGTHPDNDAKSLTLADGSAWDWVVATVRGEKVRFRLVAPQTGPAVPPFYISETKITNRLYSGGDDTPVVNVTAFQAREFAQKTFGGDLPSDDEWDHAVGFFDPHDQLTPTLPPGRAWVDKPDPGPVKRPTPEADVNRFGLLDMAGNGREWTRTVLTRTGEKRDLAAGPLADTDKLILRGRNYTLDRPLSFAILEKERATQPQAATPTAGSPYTSFRVVLKLP